QEPAANGAGPARPACGGPGERARLGRGSRPARTRLGGVGPAGQEERGQRMPGPAPGRAPAPTADVPVPPGAGCHQLACRTGDSLRGAVPKNLGRQSDLGRGARAGGADVRVADLRAAGSFGLELPQPVPAWPTDRAARATALTLPPTGPPLHHLKPTL